MTITLLLGTDLLIYRSNILSNIFLHLSFSNAPPFHLPKRKLAKLRDIDLELEFAFSFWYNVYLISLLLGKFEGWSPFFYKAAVSSSASCIVVMESNCIINSSGVLLSFLLSKEDIKILRVGIILAFRIS